jgi:hypothetical protein
MGSIRHGKESSTGTRPLPLTDVQDDATARQLLHAAHVRLYKWPTTFAGYRAVLTVQEDERLWQGEVLVHAPATVVVQVDGDESVRAWVQESLATQVMHFAPTPFEEGDGRYVVTVDPQEAGSRLHPRGVRITLHGGHMASWYRIKEQRYTQIGRTTPDGARRINTIERYEAAADGRLYATHYVLAHFAAQGTVLGGMTSYVNEFVEPTPAVVLPARRTIWQVDRGISKTRLIELSAHRVLG